MASVRLFCFCSLLLLLLLPTPSLQLLQNQPPKLNSSDLRALFTIKNSLTDVAYATGKSFFSTWDFTSPDPCSSFSGVTCFLDSSSSSLRVTILSLGSPLSGSRGLAGSLSPAVSDLSELTQLILSPGIVTGSIPPELGKLANLRVISLPSNRFTGVIPAALSLLKSLHTLDLSHNQLTGSIPPALTALPELKVLVLASNSISGELPRVVSSPLLHLDLKNNAIGGTLPPPPPSLPPSLRYLSLSSNAMWGPLNGLESLSELTFLDLSMNRFSGPIPGPLFFSPTLSSLFLQRNNLSGGIPQEPSISGPSYGEGSIVDLSHNSLTGRLSTVLDGVESLFLNNNRLMGTVPEAYVKSVCRGSTRTLYLQHNYFTGFPMEMDVVLPDTASLCLAFNCMVPPAAAAGVMTCPASAGGVISRPMAQCLVFNNGSSKG